jgi:hypothetical protein
MVPSTDPEAESRQDVSPASALVETSWVRGRWSRFRASGLMSYLRASMPQVESDKSLFGSGRGLTPGGISQSWNFITSVG